MKFILDELEQPKAERIFVDRVEPRQIFWQAYGTAQKGLEEPYVLHYYGVGGIGKTSLHSQLIKELQERCPQGKYVDLDFDFVERREPYRVMGLLKKKLSQAWNFQFPLFDVACYTFLCRMGEEGNKTEVESFVSGSQVLNFLCDAASMVPGASMVGGILKLVDEGVAVARNLFSSKKQVLRSLESMDIRQLRDQLPVYFAADLRANLKKEKQPFVIFLDTYEKLVNEFAGVGDPLQSDWWLRGPSGLIPRLPNTLWVLGGREKLKWPQLDGAGVWDNVLHQYLLGTLSQGDADTFLQTAGVDDAAARRQIFALSGGLPVSLDLYVEQYLREGTVSHTVAPSALHERVVRYMSEEERTACTLLAVMGQWTQEQALAFAQAAGISLSPLLLERLCGFSFILTQDGVTFHMMRQVGEVLRQYCPAALSRALAAGKSSAVQQPAPVLDLDSAPEKYVSITLQTIQEEDACVEWVLDELDGPLASMRRRLDLDTYFAVLRLLKEWAAGSCPGGVLEALVDGYNGVGLFYANRPEESQEILEKVLDRMGQLGHLRALCTGILQYSHVTLTCMNAADFVEHVQPLWPLLQQDDFYAAQVAGQLAKAYEAMDLPQEAQRWSQQASKEDAPQAQEPGLWKDSRLDQIREELKGRIQQEDYTQADRDEIDALLEEGSGLVATHYEPGSKEAYLWYMLECQVYLNIGYTGRGLDVTRQLLERIQQYYGKSSGAFGMIQIVDGFLRLMDSTAQSEYREWPVCSAIFGEAHSVLQRRLGPASQYTQQACTLWKITDIGSLSIAAYREKLREIYDELERPAEALFPVGDLLDELEYLPEELDNDLALNVMASVFGGETLGSEETQPEAAPSVAQPPSLQQEEPVPTTEESQQAESPVTMAEVIRQLMVDHRPADLYTAFTNIPEKKLRNALKSYGDDPKGELIPYVLALYDATVLGNAKNGFLLFTSGVLYRESGSKQGEVLLKDLELFSIERGLVVLNTKEKPKLATFVSAKAEPAVQVLNKILDHLKSQE